MTPENYLAEKLAEAQREIETLRKRVAELEQTLPLTLDEITIAICDAPGDGMPPDARKAYVNAAVSIVALLVRGATPALTFSALPSYITELLYGWALLQRQGATLEERRVADLRVREMPTTGA